MLTADQEARIKHRLERLIHVLLTHSWDRSVSKEEFGRRCAWTVETIVDEIEHPESMEDLDSLTAAERIRQRIELRTENDWAEHPEFFAGPARTER